jgi:hypothetical protein
MLQFVCDYCRNIKQPGETWINGLAAENIGTQVSRREVLIDSAWRYERAVLRLAVHFCCVECKDNYLAMLFDRPAKLLEVENAKLEPTTGRGTVRARKAPPRDAVMKQKFATRRSGLR